MLVLLSFFILLHSPNLLLFFLLSIPLSISLLPLLPLSKGGCFLFISGGKLQQTQFESKTALREEKLHSRLFEHVCVPNGENLIRGF